MDPGMGRFLSVDPLTQFPSVQLHPYLYADASPVSGSDPLGLYTVPDAQAAMTQITSLSRFTVRFLSVLARAQSFVDTYNSVMGFVKIIEGGGLAEIFDAASEAVQNPPIGRPDLIQAPFTPRQALESLRRNLGQIIHHARVWIPWLVGKRIESFAIFLPNIFGTAPMLQPRLRIGRLDISLVSGGPTGKLGQLIGAGFQIAGKRGRNPFQIWRMDIHPFHKDKTHRGRTAKNEVAVWEDDPFNYHVYRPEIGR